MSRALLLVLLAACTREWVRDYAGHLPGTDWERCAVLLVRDKWTGKPIRGALVRQHGEAWPGPDGNWAPLLAEKRTDRYGLVWFDLPEDPGDCHWAVYAEGYAPTEAYGNRPNEEVEMERGEEVAGRLLDPTGKPLAGVVVEHKVGCAHAPGLATAVTDRDGLFVFPNVDSGGDLTFEDPRVAADYWGGPHPARRWGVRSVFTDPGAEIRGRIVWPDGTPAAGAVVHSVTSSRGPRTLVRPDGSFAFRGARLTGALEVYHDHAYWGFDLRKYRPGGPMILRLGEEEDQIDRYPVTVDVPAAKGEFVAVHLERVTDGRRFSESSLWAGRCRLEDVPGGEYILSAGDPSRRWRADPRPLRVRGPTELTLEVREQPALRVEADEEVDGRVLLADRSWALDEDTAFLPPDADAWLRVRRAGGTFVFPVGPVRDGVRTVRVPPLPRPGPKTLVFPGLEGTFTAEVLYSGADEVLLADPDDMRFETFAFGPQWLAVWHEEKGLALERIDLPLRSDARIEVRGLAFDGWTERPVRVVGPDGREVEGAWAEVEAREYPFRERPRDGARVRAWVDGFAPVYETLKGDGPYEVRLGGATLVLDLRGLPEAAFVLDGWDVTGEDLRVVLRVRPGAHTLLVGAKGRMGRVYRLVLEPRETRRLKPDLRPR